MRFSKSRTNMRHYFNILSAVCIFDIIFKDIFYEDHLTKFLCVGEVIDGDGKADHSLSANVGLDPKVDPCHRSIRNFIVITTINYPTDAVKKLASLPGWCVIIVGDAKTPKDWSWPNCTFLSFEGQMTLGYNVLPHLPTNHYGRKNLGYLYAIGRGAEVIYETDDDNLLLTDFIPTLRNSSVSLSLLPEFVDTWNHNSDEFCVHVLNIYAAFGQPTIWPRGIPLECLKRILSPPDIQIEGDFIKTQTKNGIIEKGISVGVDQGLVNGDPDLDAIFRLTRITNHGKINITFNPNSPTVGIRKGIFSPYNSQNTVHYRDAFWGLLLPITTSSRVSDIWRSYITQRLMWDTGLHLAYRTATVVQYRNPHNYLNDFVLERALYEDAGRLVNFLSNWNSSHINIYEQIEALTSELVKLQFLGSADLLLTRAWIKDLRSLNYTPPTIPESPLSLESTTKTNLAWILHFTYEPNADAVQTLLQHYGPHFQLIVIVSPTGRPGLLPLMPQFAGTEILWSSACRNNPLKTGMPGGAMVRCYVQGLRILSGYAKFAEIDYIVASNDDAILNITRIRELATEGRPMSLNDKGMKDRNPPPMFGPVPTTPYFTDWGYATAWADCQPLFAKVPDHYKSRFVDREGKMALVGPADMFFLPVTSVTEFIELGDIVGECWLEIGLVNILAMLSIPPKWFQYSDEVLIYTWVQMPPENFVGYFKTKSMAAIHPFKLSFLENRHAFINFTKEYNVL